MNSADFPLSSRVYNASAVLGPGSHHRHTMPFHFIEAAYWSALIAKKADCMLRER